MSHKHEHKSKDKDQDKYKYKYRKLKKCIKELTYTISNSNYINSYQKLNGGQYLMKINNNALQIYAKDPSGTQDLIGFIPLKPANTQPIKSISNSNTIVQRYTQAPYRSIYIDLITTWWPIDGIAQNFYDIIDAGFNIINICFMVNGQPADIALVWNRELAEINPKTGIVYRQEILNYAHAHNCSILLSTGGATETPYSTDSVAYATNVSNFVLQTSLDGIDFDLENFGPGLTAPGLTSQQTIDWLVTVTNTTRYILGNNAIISHAPQAPYVSTMGQANTWAGILGGYSSVYANAPSIDILNIQCYNQGNTNYINYNNIFIDSGSDFPHSAMMQLIPNIPLDKICIGKPLRESDASTGYNTAQEINNILISAKNNVNFIGNVFTWQWPADIANPKQFVQAWLSTVTNGL